MWNPFKHRLIRMLGLPIDDVHEQAEDICDDVNISINSDDHVLYLIDMRTLMAICVFQQHGPESYISTFCARRGSGADAFNLFKRTGMMGMTLRLDSVPRAVNFYKTLGFTIDDTHMYVGTETKHILHPDIQDKIGDESAWVRVTLPYSVVAETLSFWSDVHTIPMVLTL